MGCRFCFTGQQGFSRHLQTEEIIGQYLQAKAWLTANRANDNRVLNVVYMGQGEPLHNFAAVRDSAEILLSQQGVSLAAHKITVSTVGYRPGIQRWKQSMPPINIALSLHSAFDNIRSRLIPLNEKYPVNQLIDDLDEIPKGPKRFVTYEYLLIKDLNDSVDDAKALGQLLKGRKAYINLIPFNPFPGARYRRPTEESVIAFRDHLSEFGIPVTLRTTKGDDVLAACGQLNTAAL